MTQTAKHTPHPSPWLVLDDGQTVDGGLTIVSVSHDGFRVAHVNPDVGDGHIHCAANAALIAAAPETAAERDRLKDVLFQRDSHIEQLEHNAKVHLAAAVDMQNEISDLKKQLTQSKADFQVCHRSATVRIHEVKAINEELAGALEATLNVAEEARKEWDAAPQGMKAGKLLCALTDKNINYRADISAIHAALAKHKAGAA